jgi:hypothetical protein
VIGAGVAKETSSPECGPRQAEMKTVPEVQARQNEELGDLDTVGQTGVYNNIWM